MPNGPARVPSAAKTKVVAGTVGSTRERIRASAERLFAERGFSDVTMPMIAEASGITAGAIYKHYPGKADLFFEVMQRALQSTQFPAAASGSPNEALRGIVANFTTRRFKLFRQLAVEVHAAATKDPKVRSLLRRSLDANSGQIRDGIAAGQRTGELDPADDPEFLAWTVIVFVMGLMHLETLAPHLVGDTRWHGFVRDRVAVLIGASAERQVCPRSGNSK